MKNIKNIFVIALLVVFSREAHAQDSLKITNLQVDGQPLKVWTDTTQGVKDIPSLFHVGCLVQHLNLADSLYINIIGRENRTIKKFSYKIIQAGEEYNLSTIDPELKENTIMKLPDNHPPEVDLQPYDYFNLFCMIPVTKDIYNNWLGTSIVFKKNLEITGFSYMEFFK